MRTAPFRNLLLGLGLLSAWLPDSAVAAAPPRAVPVLTTVLEQVATRVSENARAGTAIEGRLNGAAFGAGRIEIPLANGRSVTARRLQEFRGPRGEVTWSGELDRSPGSMVILTTYKGAVSGFLHVDEEIWEIAPAAAGHGMIYQVDESRLPEESPPRPPEFDGIANATADASVVDATVQADASPAAPVTQDVLVVYTAKSVAAAGSIANMESRIVNAVAAANAAYINSQVGIILNLVGMAQTDYVENGDFGTSLSYLAGRSDGFMDDVHALRDSLHADMVSLISQDSTYCGMAYMMGTPSTGFASSAFNVVTQSCFSNQTLAHELGHNQGNDHDRVNGWGGSFPYSYGYRTCDNLAPTNGQAFRTVMAYACSGVPRLNYFSNPNVYYNGAPMGVAYDVDPASSADNARSMNATAPYVADFRTAITATAPKAPDGLAAQAQAWDRVSLAWNDNAADETGYLLQRAVNGGAWADRATLPSNSVGFTDSGLSGSTAYSYRVRAYNSAGTSTFSNSASATTPAAPPPPADPAPALVAPSSAVTIASWSNVSDESGYEVLREKYDSRKGTWSATKLTIGANVTSLQESLSSGTYRYRTRAVGPSGASNYVVNQCSTCGADGSFTIASSTTTKTTGGGRRK